MPSNTIRRDLLIAVVALAVVLIYVASGGGGFALDDSWIHQTFARNLAQFGEWSFVQGHLTAASTSPLYTVLLAIGYRVGVPYGLWTHSLGAMGLMLTGLIGARLAQLALPHRPSAPLWTGVGLVATWHLVWAGASGMETGIFGMLTLWLMLLAWREMLPSTQPRGLIGQGILFGVSWALTTLTRPEGVVLGGLIGLVMLWHRPQGWKAVLLWGFSAVLAFLAVLAPYLWLNIQLTGGILPNTAAAKFEQHAILLNIPYPRRWWDLFLAIMAGGQFLLIPTILFFIAMTVRQKRTHFWLWSIPLWWAIFILSVYAWRLPASYQHGRYVMSALPALVLMGYIGLFDALAWGKKRMVSRILTRVLAIATAMTVIFFLLVGGLTAYRADVAVIEEEMVKTAFWIKANLPADALLAIHDIGAVGYFAPRSDLLDIAGLVSPDVIPIVADADALWALMKTRDARYLMAFPDQIPGRDPTDARLCVIYTTNSPTAPLIGGANMSVYQLSWDGNCG